MNTNWNTKLRVIVLATITMAFAEVGSVTDGAAQTINMEREICFERQYG
jgi:hypothetical protein